MFPALAHNGVSVGAGNIMMGKEAVEGRDSQREIAGRGRSPRNRSVCRFGGRIWGRQGGGYHNAEPKAAARDAGGLGRKES